MKALLSVIAGFALSLGMFVSGLAVATSLIASEPERRPGPSVDVVDLWTAKPTNVNRATQDFERLPAAQQSSQSYLSPTQPQELGGLAFVNNGTVDSVTTGSLANNLHSAHIDWCTKRYRSYNPATDTYITYSLNERPCVSPFASQLTTLDRTSTSEPAWVEADPSPSSPQLLLASEGIWDGATVFDHKIYCSGRYRSYRAEDNTYQPYGGGSRKQCR
jgi:hypothetical protein